MGSSVAALTTAMGARRLSGPGTVNGVSVVCSVEAGARRRRAGAADGAALLHTLVNWVVEAARW